MNKQLNFFEHGGSTAIECFLVVMMSVAAFVKRVSCCTDQHS
jgi:hypothetical protein